ncbi:MAG TPA: phosphoribosylglycinamide formyltransferase [Spirochaetota bacterium]|nr:phosphoribosylglycinamide formyltransferase [Spirochaetota bacterium]HPC41235.1 phosphoribosylglycinamide formyltransferase [Spirochaetota bacterium]HPL15726.1 phosphoribosylglycinamide formyltransferase [Spirochaetota bacterium]HQF08153.1 phosphoribosylglycinamide formyltransferase [Spirochaetota bacterium]HQH96960.1 phosphoribosylglycinamide formyltransferase [Spirochaetota bacterium]
MKKVKIAVLVSGSGTNLQSILDKAESGWLPVEVACVISDREKAYGLERARTHGVPAYFVDRRRYALREEHEEAIMAILKKHDVELLVLAGYMRLITSRMIGPYRNRIINIHPALLPSFPGTDGYGDAWRYGVKVSGCTVHFVDEGCDTGPIILQRANPIEEGESFESFHERGLKIEHQVLPEAIKLYCEGRLKVEGRRVKILGKE